MSSRILQVNDMSDVRTPSLDIYTSNTCALLFLSTRAFSVAGPVCRNALPDYLKSSDLSFDYFKHQLKQYKSAYDGLS